ncbi:MAG: diguanylate cyclase domain-containing protein [Deltaproteobacteria bacterium]
MPPSKKRPPQYEELREQLIGLGERSLRKSYYPALQEKIDDLQRFRALLDESHDLIFLLQIPSGSIVDVNESVCQELGYQREKLLATSFDIFMAKPDLLWTVVHNPETSNQAFRLTFTTVFKKYDGSYLPVEVTLSQVSFQKVHYAVVVARDITERIAAEEELKQAHLLLEQRVEERTSALLQLAESLKAEITDRKKAEEQLKFLSLHDFSTGLYNRAYFAEEIRRLDTGRHYPVSMIICDVDGLKIINDSMGHDMGDQLLVAVANALRAGVRDGDVVARVGGDEFAILIPHVNESAMEHIISRIKSQVDKHNHNKQAVPMIISMGYATSPGQEKSIDDLYREADNYMYQNKLNNRQASVKALTKAIEKAYKIKDFGREGHGRRLWRFNQAMAQAMGLPRDQVRLLKLLVKYHDIGKLRISDSILLKPASLTAEEEMTIKGHSEYGKRIVLAIPELDKISDLVWKHHEWWDGRGYPQGASGEDIPLLCRIFAITDAYEAMTGSRPYRNQMDHEEAVKELKRMAGIQFDPDLVDIFIWVMEKDRA